MNEEYPTKYLEELLLIESDAIELVNEGKEGPILSFWKLDGSLQPIDARDSAFEDKKFLEDYAFQNKTLKKGNIIKALVRIEYNERLKDYLSFVEKVLEVIK
jgi:hypothetical protein